MNREAMRRSHAGYSYDPLPTQYDGGGSLEEDNDRLADHLKDKISALKSVSIDIRSELKYQDRLLNEMDEDFERTGGFLTNSWNRVKRLSKGGHNYYILYIFLFSMLVFFVLYLVLKFR